MFSGARIWRTLVGFLQKNHFTYAAAIAYYTLFSFFPLILILLNLSGVFIRRLHLENSIINSVKFYLPIGADLVESNLRAITLSTGKISLVALVILIWTASGAFFPLELALNEAWQVKSERGFFHRRFLAALLTLLFGYFFLLSALITTLIIRFDHYLKRLLGSDWKDSISPVLIKMLLVTVSFGLAICLFSFIYKLVPYTRVRFAQVIPSAIMGAFTWEVAKYAFTTLIRFSNYSSVYGSIASIMVILIWVYLSAVIVLFFAEHSAQTAATKKK
ncbi:MAG: YihY/virulence factor BrkB family protein [Terriglobia bacterium]